MTSIPLSSACRCIDRRSRSASSVFDLDQCFLLVMSAFWPVNRGAGVREVMTMQSDNRGDSLTDNLWAEMSLMMVLVVIVLALAWRYVW